MRPCPGNYTRERSIVEQPLGAPQSILHASLDHNALSLEKFSRWLRAICTILLSRDSGADRPRAIGFVEQAIGVLKEQRNAEVRACARFSPRGAVCVLRLTLRSGNRVSGCGKHRYFSLPILILILISSPIVSLFRIIPSKSANGYWGRHTTQA